MKYLLLTLLLINSLNCYSAIYMQTDNNGNVTYSDAPSINTVKIDDTNSTLPAQITPDKKTAESELLSTNATSVAHKPYTLFAIQDPVDQQTFQNQREIPVQLRTRPLLQKGDKIQLYVDGAPVGEPLAQTLLMLHQMDRGTHHVYAVLFSKDMRILKQTDSIIIYVHYAHVGQIPPS